MTADIYYSVCFGRGDGSETMDSEVELLPKEEAAYRKAVLLRIPLDEVPELESALSRAYDEIQEAETDNACDLDDEFAQECVDDGESPFDSGWELNVEFADPHEDDDVSEEEAAAAFKYLFSFESINCDEVQDYLNRLNSDFYCDFDPERLARKIAFEMDAEEYLKQFHTYTFTIHISNGGDSEIDYPVTEEEMVLIQEAVDNGEQLEDIEDLSDLYDSVTEAARNQLAEDLDICNENDLDPDDLEYQIDFT